MAQHIDMGEYKILRLVE